MVAKRFRAGMGNIPACFFAVVVLILTSSAAFSVALAIPTDEDPFPDPNEKPAKKVMRGERLIEAAKRALEDPEYPPPTIPDAVEFALWCYAESGNQEDLLRAKTLALEMAGGHGGVVSGRQENVCEFNDVLVLLQVAQAGGVGPATAASILDRTPIYFEADLLQAELIEALMRGDRGSIAGILDECHRVLNKGPKHLCPVRGKIANLQLALFVASLTGSGEDLEDAVQMGRRFIQSHWDEGRNLFRTEEGDEDESRDLLWDVRTTSRAAKVLWEIGYAAGDTALTVHAERALASAIPHAERELASDFPQARAWTIPAALAAARIEDHPVQMVLLGDPEDSTLTALREACVAMFEPRKIIINLDPARDAERIETLMYPVELAPALFVCVESICSTPIKDPGKLESTVKAIVAAAPG